MTISERLFKIMDEKGITAYKLAKMTGIPARTVFDWRKKNTNPGADKIMIICEVLQITTNELLMGDYCDEKHVTNQYISSNDIDIQIMNEYQDLSESKKKRLLAYMSMLQNMKE